MSRLTYAQIQNLSDEYIRSLTANQAKKLLKEVRQKYYTRYRQLEKIEDKVFSFAKFEMDEWRKEHPERAISSMKIGETKAELTKLRNFFKAETSTEKGARRVNKEQDIAIFGQTKSGRPKDRMTTVERTKFWSTYYDFINIEKTADYVHGYKNIWQQLGEMVIQRKGQGTFNDYFIELVERLETLEDKNNDFTSTGTGPFGSNNAIYSGDWDGWSS